MDDAKIAGDGALVIGQEQELGRFKNTSSWTIDDQGIRIFKNIQPLKVKNNNNELKYTCQHRVGPLWHRRAFLPLEINEKYKKHIEVQKQSFQGLQQ